MSGRNEPQRGGELDGRNVQECRMGKKKARAVRGGRRERWTEWSGVDVTGEMWTDPSRSSRVVGQDSDVARAR